MKHALIISFIIPIGMLMFLIGYYTGQSNYWSQYEIMYIQTPDLKDRPNNTGEMQIAITVPNGYTHYYYRTIRLDTVIKIIQPKQLKP